MEKHYAVITGASSGIGRSFAALLAKEGYSLILIARREEELRRIAAILRRRYHTDSLILPCDLSDRTATLTLCGQLRSYPIELFINNAGFGEAGHFCETSLEKELQMIDVNVTAMHIFTKRILQQMKEQGYGRILNVASSAGLLPAGPYMAAYYASKAYIASLTRAAAEELRREGSPVYLGCLCPGPVDTAFNEHANVLFALKGISAHDCVAIAWQQMQKGRHTIIPTLRMQLVCVGQRFVPRAIAIPMTAKQQKRKIEE